MGFRGRTAAGAAAAATAALIAATAASCSGSGTGGGSATVEGVSASACAALSQQVSSYRWTDQSSGTNVNAGALRHSARDKWTVTGPAALDGKDPVDVVGWLKLKNPGSAPAECRSPVTAPHAGSKPYTEALLFPAGPGVQASLTKQFQADTAPYRTGGSITVGTLPPVAGGSLLAYTATDASLDQPQLDLDVDFLTTFHHGGRSYVVLYRDPVVTATSDTDPNRSASSTAPPSADG